MTRTNIDFEANIKKARQIRADLMGRAVLNVIHDVRHAIEGLFRIHA